MFGELDVSVGQLVFHRDLAIMNHQTFAVSAHRRDRCAAYVSNCFAKIRPKAAIEVRATRLAELGIGTEGEAVNRDASIGVSKREPHFGVGVLGVAVAVAKLKRV